MPLALTLVFQKCISVSSAMLHLSSLLPLANDADDAAECSSQTNNTVVEGDQSKGGAGDGEVAEIGEELLSGSGALTRT